MASQNIQSNQITLVVNADFNQNVNQVSVSLQQLQHPDCFSQLLLSVNLNTELQEKAIQAHQLSELEERISDLEALLCEGENPENAEPFGFS